jgi:alpha-D-ribose 1-methylphosphonate 5-triphosphate synthase subunit PhnG
MSAGIDTAGPLEHRAEAERSFARSAWLAILAKATVDELEAGWNALADKPQYRMLRRPETGLVMLRGCVGGTGQPFNLGEMTMTRAAVQLLDDTGDTRQTGFGHVAGRSGRHAELVALFDALLQVPARHDMAAAQVVGPIAARQQASTAAQAAKAAATKVDFFTMVRGE